MPDLKPYDLSVGKAKRIERCVEACNNNDVQILVDDLRIGAKGKASRGMAGSLRIYSQVGGR